MGSASTKGKSRLPVDLAPVRAAIEPILVSHGVVLVDLEWLGGTAHGGTTLRVTIELPGSNEVGGGVNLDDCAEVSRDVSQALDVEDLIPVRYNLEVSSPGLDRPLKTLSDFRRFEGKLAKVKLSRPAPDGQHVLRGTLVAPSDAREERVAVSVDGHAIEVPYRDVSAAQLVFELDAQPKAARPKAARPKAAGSKKTGAKASRPGRSKASRAKSKR